MIKIPSEQEIQEVESQLNEMKRVRQEATKRAFANVGDILDTLPDVLSTQDMVHLVSLINTRLKGGHKRVRGNPVPDTVRRNLEETLRKRQHTLAQLGKMFGLSISYISRVKHEIGLTRPKGDRYIDRPLSHHTPQAQMA